MTTQWLEEMLTSVPPDFNVRDLVEERCIPAGAVLLGPLPNDIVPLAMALLYHRMIRSSLEQVVFAPQRILEGFFWSDLWKKKQVETLSALLSASIHYHFEVFDRAVGVAVDTEGHLVVYGFPPL